MKTLLTVMILLSASAHADEWRESDTYREATYQVLNVIDWGQTRYIAEHPEQFREKGAAFFIGKHPSIGTVNNYMIGSAILHLIASNYLPHKWREAFQYVTIGDKLNATVSNFSVGIKVSF